jgi:antirestriction protein ArdC
VRDHVVIPFSPETFYTSVVSGIYEVTLWLGQHPGSPVSTKSIARYRAEMFFAALGTAVGHGGNRAFYNVTNDTIQMPPFVSFQDADSYYATLAHECTYWTDSTSRLNRDFGGHRFGSEGYALEELVAELGAAFLCADLELTLEPREDHASYIATWLNVLAQDNRALFTAAANASVQRNTSTARLLKTPHKSS